MNKTERYAMLFMTLVILLFTASAIRSGEIEGAEAFLMIESILAGAILLIFLIRVYVVQVTVRSRLYYGKIWVTVWLSVMIAKYLAQIVGLAEFSAYVIAWGIIMTLLRIAIDRHDKEMGI